MMPRRSRLARNAMAAFLVVSCALAGVAAPLPPSPADAAIQMLADVTLIDAECRNVHVVFGTAFRAGGAKGLRVSDIMPTGPLRRAFAAAYRKRFAETPHDELCGDLVRAYSAEMPGLFTTP